MTLNEKNKTELLSKLGLIWFTSIRFDKIRLSKCTLNRLSTLFMILIFHCNGFLVFYFKSYDNKALTIKTYNYRFLISIFILASDCTYFIIIRRSCHSCHKNHHHHVKMEDTYIHILKLFYNPFDIFDKQNQDAKNPQSKKN